MRAGARRSLSALPWFAVFVVPAAFQFLYGTHDLGLVEEWEINQLFAAKGTVFWTPLDNHGAPGLAAQAIRPLTVAPHSIAFLLDSNSFAWYHVLNAVGLGLTGLAMMTLLIQLGLRRAVAVCGGLVLALFPAWTGLFTFRMIHGHLAIAALVFAMAQLLAYSRRPSLQRGLLICLCLAVSLLLYEVSYVALLFVPLLLFVTDRLTVRQFVHRSAVWFAVPFLNGLRIVLIFRSGQPLYERDLVTTTARAPKDEMVALLKLVYRKGLGAFISGPMGSTLSLSAVVLASVVVGTCILASRTRAEVITDPSPDEPDDDTEGDITEVSAPAARPNDSDRRLAVLAVAAFASAPVVALIYASQPAHLKDPLRVFSIASLPLALGIAVVLELIARHARVVALFAVFAVISSTAAAANAQRDFWHERSAFEEHLLGAVAEASLGAPEATSLVIIDTEHVIGGPTGNDVYSFIPVIFRQAVEYALPDVLRLIICHHPLDQLPTSSPIPDDCVLNGGVVANYLDTITVADAAVIEIRSSTMPRWPSTVVPLPNHRARSLLHCVATATCDDGTEGFEARLLSGAQQP